jgi:hypothetical protein
MESKIFSTRDLYLAATLVSMRFYVINVDYQLEGSRPVGYFNFEDSEDLRNAENDYWQGRLAVEPRTFVTNLRGLKAKVNNIYKGPHTDISKMKLVDNNKKKK